VPVNRLDDPRPDERRGKAEANALNVFYVLEGVSYSVHMCKEWENWGR
jgi:hypothetical protein